MGKTRASNKKPPVTAASKTKKGKNKRLFDEDTDIDIPRVEVESGDEVSEVQKSGNRDGVSVKRSKYGISFVNEELESRFKQLDLGNRRIVLGRPVAGNFYHKCGAIEYFKKLGFESFVSELPRECYPSLVYEFYANLVIIKPAVFSSTVRGHKIMLTTNSINDILGIDKPSTVSITTKKGPTELENFSELDQLKIVRGIEDLSHYAPPTTTTVTPIAHVLFKICIDNINPRTGTRSNFAGQDVTVVSMLLSEKPFNLAGLILKNMLDVFEPNTANSLPYGLFLTSVFKWFGIKLDGEEFEEAKEFLDAKSLHQSHLKVQADGTVIRIEIPPPPPVTPHPSTPASSVNPIVSGIDHSADFKQLHAAVKRLTDQVKGMAAEVTSLREIISGSRSSVSTRTGMHSRATQLHDLADIAVGNELNDTVAGSDVDASGDILANDAKENDDNNES